MRGQHGVDPALVTAARAGDSRAQDALVGAYLPLVYNVVGRALNGSVDVDDVVQNTMLRALDGLDGLRTPENFRSWLVAIAMNQVRAHWQDRQLAPGGVEEAEHLADPGADFVDLTMWQLQLSGQRRETALATRWLEPDDRAVLSLWWLECAGELTRTEVADALELSPQHTAVQVQRMKAQLETARVVVRALDAQPSCAELHGVIASWDGRPSALWRKRIARHARGCVRCAGLWNGLMPAEGLLAGLALIAVSPGLLAALRTGPDGMVAAGSATRPEDGGSHGGGDHGGGGHGSRGGAHAGTAGRRAPRGGSASRLEARRRRRARRRALGGAVIAVCVAGGGLWYFAIDSGTPDDRSTTARTADDPVMDLSAPGADATSASPSASASPSPSPSASKTAKKPKPSKKTSRPPRPSAPAPATSAPPAPAASAVPRAQPAPAGTVDQVVALVNQERAAAGCGPVTEDPELEEAALNHSADMAARDFFDHSNPDGEDPGERITAAGYRWSTYGENIARGQQTPAAVMDSWMNSPGHRANILNCSFKNIGVGVHKGSGGPWWTQDFGAKL
ncbi:sigma-70 family RNA polymerase sigma factor [Streptomyces sp. NPDC007084]|uniref:sigma-70 family RNA polymerase sigma factor n=1 Tax=Streptomyces sp. NPDC007084 TaxID=3154313 RepID=UPI0034552913